MLYLGVVVIEVSLDIGRGDIDDKSADLPAFQHHEEGSDPDKYPLSNHSTNRTHERYTSCRQRRDLVRQEELDATSILFNDIERLIKVLFSESELDNSFYIGMEVETWQSLLEVDCLRGIGPVDDKRSGIRDIGDHYWYDGTYDYASEYDDHYIDPYDSEPSWYTVSYSFIDEWIDDNRDKSCDEKDDDESLEDIEYPKECRNSDDNE